MTFDCCSTFAAEKVFEDKALSIAAITKLNTKFGSRHLISFFVGWAFTSISWDLFQNSKQQTDIFREEEGFCMPYQLL